MLQNSENFEKQRKTVPSERNSYWGGGAAHCFPSHSVHCYKGNILQFDNYLVGSSPPAPGSDGPGR